jgi:glycosyltransferase involved in cell wall biosynthesis
VSDGPAGPHRERVTVVLDAQALTSVAAGGGIGSYTRHLLGALAKRDDLDLHALCVDPDVVPGGVTPIPIHRWAHRPRLEAREHAFRVRYDLLRHRPAGSVFHNPSFHAPARVSSPWVQTLLDVIPLVDDSPDLAVLRARWKRFGPRYQKADAVIAISHHAADEGIRMLGLDAGRVHVASLGVGENFVPGSGPTDPPYVLAVAQYSRRKGFAEAFAVMDALVEAGYPHRLVVAGAIHPWARAELTALHGAARHPNRIELRDAVPDLVPLYQGATAFLMTSRSEGFGLTALEAMACGVPVVAFANTSLPEVVGQGGQLVADGDVVAMTAAVRSVIDDAGCASEWRERSVARARLFSWTECAARHAEVYHSVRP